MRELLQQKAVDYGYGSLEQMSEELGLYRRTLRRVVNREHGPGIGIKRLICQELDVDPDVLERVIRHGDE